MHNAPCVILVRANETFCHNLFFVVSCYRWAWCVHFSVRLTWIDF